MAGCTDLNTGSLASGYDKEWEPGEEVTCPSHTVRNENSGLPNGQICILPSCLLYASRSSYFWIRQLSPEVPL